MAHAAASPHPIPSLTEAQLRKLTDVLTRSLTFCSASAAVLCSLDANELAVVCATGAIAPKVGARTTVLEAGLADSIRMRRPHRVDDTHANAVSNFFPVAVRSFASVPVVRKDAVVGMLIVLNANPKAFTPTHVAVLQTLADVASETLGIPAATTAIYEPSKPLVVKPIVVPSEGNAVRALVNPSHVEPSAPEIPQKPKETEVLSMADAIDFAPRVAAPAPRPVTPRPPAPAAEPKLTLPKAPAKSHTSTQRIDIAPARKRRPSIWKRVAVIAACASLVILVAGTVSAGVLYSRPLPQIELRNSPKAPPVSRLTPAPAPVAAAPVFAEVPVPVETVRADNSVVRLTSPAAASALPPETEDLAAPKSRQEPVRLSANAAHRDQPVEAPSLAIASSAPVLAAPAAPAVVKLAPGAGEIKPPSVISSVKPEYPEMALRSRTQGEVVALVDVDAKGTPVTIKVVGGPQMLYLSTMDAIRKWKFQPAMQDGHAVASQTRISIRYNLPR